MSEGQADQPEGGTISGRPARPPWGCLGMLAFLILVEGTLGRHDLDFTAPWHWDWRVSGKLASKKQAGADVLLFGDSVLKFGVMPKVLQERSRLTAYNFALHTGQTSSSYFMLKRVLDAGYRPKALIFDMTPHMFSHMPEENARLWPELLSPVECFDLAWTMGSPRFFASTVLASLIPSIKERHDIRASLLATVSGKPSPSRRFEIPTYRRNWKLNDGGQLMPDGDSPPIDPAFWARSLYPYWNPNPVNVAYLDRFLTLAGSASIPVVWLLPPVQPALQDQTEASGFDADYTRFVERVVERFPLVSLADARKSGFEADEFNDGIHLKRPGALRLSASLGELLRKVEDRPRWARLDAGRPRSVESAIEDVGQSAVALRGGQLGVRR